MRILIAALLSVALIWLAPAKTEHSDINIHHNELTQSRTEKLPQEGLQPTEEKAPEQVTVKSGTVAAQTTDKPSEPAPQQTGCEVYRPLLEQYNWEIRIAMAVMEAESGCNPTILSPTADRGLLQINAVHADMVSGNLNALYDPATNIQVAHRVYLSQGWRGWSAYNNGSYLKFL